MVRTSLRPVRTTGAISASLLAGQNVLHGGVGRDPVVQVLDVGIGAQTSRQELRGPADHREGIGVDDGSSALKDEIPAVEVALEMGKLLGDQFVTGFYDGPLRGFALIGGVSIGHEDRPEGGMNVGCEEGGPAMRLGFGPRAFAAAQPSLWMLPCQIIEDRAGLCQGPAVILAESGHGARRIDRAKLFRAILNPDCLVDLAAASQRFGGPGDLRVPPAGGGIRAGRFCIGSACREFKLGSRVTWAFQSNAAEISMSIYDDRKPLTPRNCR